MPLKLSNTSTAAADSASGPLMLERFQDKTLTVDELLAFCTEHKCSDLYIKVGNRPFITRWGMVHEVPCMPTTTRIWNDWAKEAISSENNARYVRSKMLDFSYSIPLPEEFGQPAREYRYRVSAGFSMRRNVATFRMITTELPSFKTIKFPEVERDILNQVLTRRQGIVLFVGVTGSGKTTTMAACINDFTQPGGGLENTTIISLEDPIEYIFPSTERVNIMQKEYSIDFKSWPDGVRQALREHPNLINVGETRDRETVETLVEASRTGHLCVSSFHASDAADTIARMYNMLVGQNEGIMYDVIANMNLILCQKLLANETGDGFRMMTQYVVFNDEIKEHLNRSLSDGDSIPLVVAGLLQNKVLLDAHLVKNWG